MGKKENNRLETWGNETTMNMNAIIYQNILSSPYFRSLYEKKTFHEIVDEIYNEVTVLTPFIKGNQPSTAFCLLFKLWTIRLTVRQIENLVEHGDSPYIRAIGFLYLRYVCAPAKLWDWFQYYLEDDEEIAISSGLHPTKVTVGNLIRMLITELKFQGTMLPRIPIPIARDLEKKLKEYDEAKKKEKGSEVIKVITVIEGTKVDPEVMTEDIGIDRLMIEDTEIDHQVMIEDIRADQGAREGLEEMNLMSTNVIEKDQETEGMTTGQEDIDTQGQEKDIKNFVC
ncbi:PRP38 pre-mRNA processing factor 38 domain-containing protein B [Rhizopus azygosporus]|uniref:Pre-mRNA-splicing factor 38 n=1 Tax=Rhizopus azygosporus TaxID=86630 RepID=A0A367IYW5_RHIAZ|nr:PRP38 pre-mRNA processing factor 38 domain-containing protein B [Rhizopus azygosporus]